MSLSRLTDTRSRTVAHGQLLHAMGYSEHGSRTSLARPRFTDSISTDHAKCQDGCARSTRTQCQVPLKNEYVNYSKSTLVLMAKDRGVSHRGDIPDIVARLVADDSRLARRSGETKEDNFKATHFKLSPKVNDFSDKSCTSQRSDNRVARVICSARDVLSRLEGELANPGASRASLFPARPRVSTRPATGEGVRSPARSERSYREVTPPPPTNREPPLSLVRPRRPSHSRLAAGLGVHSPAHSRSYLEVTPPPPTDFDTPAKLKLDVIRQVVQPHDIDTCDRFERVSIPDLSWADHVDVMLENNCSVPCNVAYESLKRISAPTAADSEPFALSTKPEYACYGMQSASFGDDGHLSNCTSQCDVILGKEGVANVEKSSHVPSNVDIIDVPKVFVKPRFDDLPPVNSGPVDSGPMNSGSVNSHSGVPISTDSCLVAPCPIDSGRVIQCHILEPKILMQKSFSCIERFAPGCESHLSDICDTRDACFGGRGIQQYAQKLLDHFPDDHNRSKRPKIWFLKILDRYSTHDFGTLEPVIVWNLNLLELIFTCLNVRASHVEVVDVATSLDVSSLMYASRFFVVRRSALMPLFTNRGSNLVAPEKEIKFFDCLENEFFEFLSKEHFEKVKILRFKFSKFKFEMLRFEVEYCDIDFLLGELKGQGKRSLRSIGKLVAID